jgi:hypothetical protein
VIPGKLAYSLGSRRFPEIDDCLFSGSILSPIALPASLDRGAVLNQGPSLSGKNDPAILVFFHSEDQASTAPNDGRVELIPIGGRWIWKSCHP